MGSSEIKNIAVAGAGTMGHSIAQVFAQKQYTVHLTDVSEERLQAAERQIRANVETLIEAEVYEGDAESVLDHITFTSDSAVAYENADVLFEAVSEVREVKKKVFSEMDRFAPNHALLASNTSFLNIFSFIETQRPKNVLIAHWYAPPHIIPLVDVVKGPETSQQTIDTMLDLLHCAGKKTVFFQQFVEGYITNRFQMAIREVIEGFLKSGICTPKEIDLAVRTSLAVRMPILGVMQKMDFTGIDLTQQIQRNDGVSCTVVDDMVARGELGIKTSKGFFDYKGYSQEEITKIRDLYCLEVIKLMDRLDVWDGII